MNSVLRKYWETSEGAKDPRGRWALTQHFADEAKKAGTLDKLLTDNPDFAKDYEQLRQWNSASTLGGIGNAAKNAWDSSMQALGTLAGVDDQDAEDIAKREKRIAGRKLSIPWQDWQQAEGDEAVKVFLRDPVEITSNIVASGFAGSIPSLAMGMAGGATKGAVAGAPGLAPGAAIGATIGAATGAGLGSLATEYGTKYLEVLREAGVDLTDPQAIKTAVQDEALTDKAMKLGLQRGLPVAAFDAISMGLAGKWLGGALRGAKETGKTLSKGRIAAIGTGEMLGQGALGAGGEVAGALAAGDEVSPKAAFEEFIGEVGPGAAEVAYGAIRRNPSLPDQAATNQAALDEARRAARIAAANMTQQAAPATPAAPPPQASAARSVALMSDDQKVARLEVLEGLVKAGSALSEREQQELTILRAITTLSSAPATTAAAAKNASHEETLQGKEEGEVGTPPAPGSAIAGAGATPPAPAAQERTIAINYAVYSATDPIAQRPNDIDPLAAEDVAFELEVLEGQMAAKKWAPEEAWKRFVWTETGKRLQLDSTGPLKDHFLADPAGTLRDLRERALSPERNSKSATTTLPGAPGSTPTQPTTTAGAPPAENTVAGTPPAAGAPPAPPPTSPGTVSPAPTTTPAKPRKKRAAKPAVPAPADLPPVAPPVEPPKAETTQADPPATANPAPPTTPPAAAPAPAPDALNNPQTEKPESVAGEQPENPAKKEEKAEDAKEEKKDAAPTPTKLDLHKDGIIGEEVPYQRVPLGNDAFQYALGKVEEDGGIAIFRRKASERGTYGGWRLETDANKLLPEPPPTSSAPPPAKKERKPKAPKVEKPKKEGPPEGESNGSSAPPRFHADAKLPEIIRGDDQYNSSSLVENIGDVKAVAPRSHAKTDAAILVFEMKDGRVVAAPIRHTKDGFRVMGLRAKSNGDIDPMAGKDNVATGLDDLPGKPIAVLRSKEPFKLVFETRAHFDKELGNAGAVHKYDAKKASKTAQELELERKARAGDPGIASLVRGPWVKYGVAAPKFDFTLIPSVGEKRGNAILAAMRMRSDGKPANDTHRTLSILALRAMAGNATQIEGITPEQRAMLKEKVDALSEALGLIDDQVDGKGPVGGDKKGKGGDKEGGGSGESGEKPAASKKNDVAEAAAPKPEAPKIAWASLPDNAIKLILHITKAAIATKLRAHKGAVEGGARDPDRIMHTPLSQFLLPKAAAFHDILEVIAASGQKFDSPAQAIEAIAASLKIEKEELLTHATEAIEAADGKTEQEKTDKQIALFKLDSPHGDDRPLSMRQAKLADSKRSAFFARVVTRLSRLGINVEQIARNFVEANATGVTYDGYHIAVALADIHNPSVANLITVIHEAAHAVLKQMGLRLNSRETKVMMSRAMQGLVERARKASEATGVAPATNITFDYEEALVESVAQEIAAIIEGDGFTIARQIVSWFKELYNRMVMAVNQWMGRETSPEVFESWFRNHLAGIVGGRFDYVLSDLFRSATVRAAPVIDQTGGIGGFLNPYTGEMQLDRILPVHVDAVTQYQEREIPTPTGKPSKLSPALQRVVRTPEFKAWFGDWENDPANASKVIDKETGEPMVVYHGTDREFFVFDRDLMPEEGRDTASYSDTMSGIGVAHFATSRAVAQRFANGVYRKKNGKPVVMEVFLNIRKMYWDEEESIRQDILQGNVDTPGVDATLEDDQALIERYERDPEYRSKINALVVSIEMEHYGYSETQDRLVEEYKVNFLDKEGLDGVNYINQGIKEVRPGDDPNAYIIRHPTQAKSIWNTGSFSPTNPHIRYQTRAFDPNVDSNIPSHQSDLMEQAAALNAFKAALDQAQGSMELAEFWKIVGKHDHPSLILEKMEEQMRGVSTVTTADPRMTDAMRGRGLRDGLKMIRRAMGSMLRKAQSLEESAEKAQESLLEKAEAVNELHNKFRDAAVQENHFRDSLKGLVREYAAHHKNANGLSFKAGRLAEAIAQADKRLEGDAIPAEYQEVFKAILDDKVAITDYMAAMARLGISFGIKSGNAIRAEVEAAAPGDPVLAKLVENRALFIALTELARVTHAQMDLLALGRFVKGDELKAISDDIEAIRRATPDLMASMNEKVRELLRSTSLRERIRGHYVAARGELTRAQKVIINANENVAILRRTAAALDEAALKLEPDVGAFSTWVPTDGAKWLSMVRKGSEWVAEQRELRLTNDGRAEDPELLDRLAMNGRWLMENANLKGTRKWNEVEQQTRLMKLADFKQGRQSVHRFLIDRLTQSLQKRFASLGKPAGTIISRQLFKFQTIMEGEQARVEAKAIRWQRAASEAITAAGYKGNATEFYDEILGRIIYSVESESGYGEHAALRHAAKVARNLLASKSAKVAPNFDEKLAALLREHKVMSETLRDIAEKNGVYIEDESIKDPLGLGEHNLMRRAIAYGWLTSTRSIRADTIRLLTDRMKKAGWEYGVKKVQQGNKEKWIFVDGSEHMGEFTPEVVQDFLEPFIYKPGQPVFRTPEGDRIPQHEIAQLWEQADKDVDAWLELLEEAYPASEGTEDPSAHWMGQIQKLYVKMANIAVDTLNPATPLDATFTVQPHRLMDARKDDLIPPEFLAYDAFDQTSARIALAQVAFAAAFGRNGRDFSRAMYSLRSELSADVAVWEHYAGDKRRIERANYDYKALKASADNNDAIGKWHEQWLAAFGAGQTSQNGDLRVGLDTLRMLTGMVLNQPTSGFWNWASTFEFPSVFGGINKEGVRASARAMAEATRSLFGRLGEAVGTDILRKAEWRDVVDDVMLRRGVKNASYADLMLDAGFRGKMEQGRKRDKWHRFVRRVGKVMQKANILAPFRVLNEAAGEGIIRGMLGEFETMIGKGIRYFQQHPEAFSDPNFRFTPKTLGMEGSGIFGSESTYNYFRTVAADYGMGGLEDIVRAAVERRASGKETTLLTRDQVIALATMALNDVALEASINSRPEWVRHPTVQWAMPLLGWPIAKMGLVSNTFKGQDGSGITADVKGARNFARGMGIMLGWTLPMGLAFSLLMDEWDEEVKGKKQNRMPVDGIAAVPIIGPVAALAGAGENDAWTNFQGMGERAIRAGSFGIGTEILMQFAIPLDPTSGQKAFSLDNRVFVVSAIRSLGQAAMSWIGGEAFTYANTGRPFLQALGMNGPLEGVQIMSNLLDLDNQERRMATRTSVRNWLTVAGKEAGIPVRPRISMAVTPTPVTIWIREMELAAFSGDRLRFVEAYRNAVDAARRRDPKNPEGEVLTSWRSKHPFTIFQSKDLTPEQKRRLAEALGPEGNEIVSDALSSYERFTSMIEPSPMQQRMKRMTSAMDPQRMMRSMSPEALRRQAASF